MANRSYLYNLDIDRLERAKKEGDKISGVAEYAYEIPIAFKILLSCSTSNTFSILWQYEKPIAISGDAAEGKERLFSFLEKLKEKGLFESQYIENETKKTQDFFTKNDFELQYFFLESGELYEMSDKPFEEQNLEVFNDVVSIGETIDLFYKSIAKLNQEIDLLKNKKDEKTQKRWFRKSKFVLNEYRRLQIAKEINNKKLDKRRLLGIDNWSTILYYHF